MTLCSLFQKWRRRWFVLQQGKLPRQYLLNYYQDDTKKKLKGTIALDDCEQVRHLFYDLTNLMITYIFCKPTVARD